MIQREITAVCSWRCPTNCFTDSLIKIWDLICYNFVSLSDTKFAPIHFICDTSKLHCKALWDSRQWGKLWEDVHGGEKNCCCLLLLSLIPLLYNPSPPDDINKRHAAWHKVAQSREFFIYTALAKKCTG